MCGIIPYDEKFSLHNYNSNVHAPEHMAFGSIVQMTAFGLSLLAYLSAVEKLHTV